MITGFVRRNSRATRSTGKERSTPRSSWMIVTMLVLGFASSQAAAATPEEDVSALLKARTQAFSDAGQRGDGATMAAMLDERVVFFNEGGDQASKGDMAQGGPAPPSGVSVRMTVEDWHCEIHGDVAVTSFVDRQEKDFHGQLSEARFRSVETWQRSSGDWKMISSETLALVDDPPAVRLPTDTLDEYVGRYEASPGVQFTFVRRGDDIFATNGGPLSVQKAELRDVLFTPGHSRFRKVFSRDAQGRVTGFAYRSDGHDLVFAKVPQPLAPRADGTSARGSEGEVRR